MKLKKSETYRNEIKSDIVRAGRTMTEVVDSLSDEYGWSRSVPNLSGRLKRGSLRSGEARNWPTHWTAVLHGKRGDNHDRE